MKPDIKRKVSGRGGVRGKRGVHLCCNTCCEHMQLIYIELLLPGDNAKNGLIYCNLIPRIPGNLDNMSNIKCSFVCFS